MAAGMSVVDDLKRYDLVYLSTPYTKYPDGIEVAWKDACEVAAHLLKEGVSVYSPIAHTHPIAVYGDLDPLDHTIWLPFDEAIMEKSDAIVVAEMDTWRKSFGVQHEIETFKAAGKPVFYLPVGDILGL